MQTAIPNRITGCIVHPSHHSSVAFGHNSRQLTEAGHVPRQADLGIAETQQEEASWLKIYI